MYIIIYESNKTLGILYTWCPQSFHAMQSFGYWLKSVTLLKQQYFAWSYSTCHCNFSSSDSGSVVASFRSFWMVVKMLFIIVPAVTHTLELTEKCNRQQHVWWRINTTLHICNNIVLCSHKKRCPLSDVHV